MHTRNLHRLCNAEACSGLFAVGGDEPSERRITNFEASLKNCSLHDVIDCIERGAAATCFALFTRFTIDEVQLFQMNCFVYTTTD